MQWSYGRTSYFENKKNHFVKISGLESTSRDMDAVDDPIKALLEKTGLSCDDLLQKLLAFKSQEKNKNKKDINGDGVLSGKTNDSSTNGACSNSDSVEMSARSTTDEEYYGNTDHSTVNNINSSNDIPNSMEECCAAPQSSDIFLKKNMFDSMVVANINIKSNILINRSNDYENISHGNLNLTTKGEENPVNNVLTKETYNNTFYRDNNPKNFDEEIPHTTTSLNDASNLHNGIRSIQLEENIFIKNEENDISYNTALQSSQPNCLGDDRNEETPYPVGFSNIDVSATEVLPSCILKNANLIDKSNEHNFSMISLKGKSISDQLVRRLVHRVSEDEIKVNEQIRKKSNIKRVSEMSQDNDGKEKEEFKITETVPFLKLRSDLFPTDRKLRTNTGTCHDSKEVNRSHKQDYSSEKVNNLSDTNTSENFLAVNDSESGTSNTKIRKVKVGFLKKKILHKALRHLSRADSVRKKMKRRNRTFAITNSKKNLAYSFQRPFQKLILEPHVDTPEAQEEIRKNLKLQLNSLRNRKKTGNTTDPGQCNKFQSISDLKFNYKKQLLHEEIPNSSTSAIATSTAIDECQASPSCVTTEPSVNNFTEVSGNDVGSLFSLSEETNFMIIDVQGGVEFPENEVNDTSKEFQYDAIKLTKTNDITKIKGWKNKKFDMVMKKSHSEKGANENQPEESSAYDTISSTSASRDDTNSVETLKIDENGSEQLSPFVSNTLEEFLTENSRLNISYKIPKLGAEEGIKEVRYRDIVLPKTLDLPHTREAEKKDKPKGIKPKTLAEKRRMLEGKISKDRCAHKEEQSNISKTSYIYFNRRKLFVPSTSSNKCLADIRFKPSRCIKPSRLIYKSDNMENEISTAKKLSLLKLWLEKSKIVTYKPGPLSKKRRLQNSESISSWDTVVQKLPKVQLEIIQEFGKKIPPFLVSFLPKPGTIIRSDYLEFALSALHTKTKSSEQTRLGFRFSLPYCNNQKYMLMRKRNQKCEDTIVCHIEPEKNSVACVIDDIIKYVETKELGDSIIKDAEPYEEEQCIRGLKRVMTSDINVDEDNIAKKNNKRRKLELELQRLSCKVVSVTVEDTEIVNNDCSKPYCKLGCICRSLAYTSHLPLHCFKKDCMFECKCSAGNGDISLSGEIPLLSGNTVTRIEDQAKRNLARVEKEFTQTIIRANNKTILIPSSDRSKTKRLKRTPKRYSDFLENHGIEQENVIVPKENQKSKLWQDFEMFYCYVKLQKLDIKSVVPLCLDHNCYNCECMKEIVLCREKKLILKDKESSVEENAPIKKIKKLKTHENETNIIESNTTLKHRPSSGNDTETDNNPNTPMKTRQKGECARVRGVHPEISARNELPYYKSRLRLRIKNIQNQNKFDHSLPTIVNYEETHSSVIDVTTAMPISASERLKYLLFTDLHTRKQFQEVWDDSISDSLTCTVKNIKTQPKKAQESLKEDIQSDLPYATIFDGEIVIPTNANKDFVKNLGVKSVAPYMRLLPWNDLLKNYYSLKINIWCSYDKSDKLLINRSHIKPPEGYIDIKQSSRKNGIMMWILTKELPKKTPGELVHLILSPNKEHFEISGICLKNISSSQEKKKFENANDEKYKNKPDNIEEVQKIVNDNADKEKQEFHDSNFLEHKNYNNELNILCLTQHIFCPQYFRLAGKCEIYKEKFPLAIELPAIQSECKWRMLYLNSNFSFLSFINNKYSIKYTDLMHILKKAQNSNKTICLQSQQLSSGYRHKKFGIYAVSKYNDRLFIGPYGLNEEHGLETLRYLRQSLVTTFYFEMIQGVANPSNKNALWLTADKRFNKTDANQRSLLRRSSHKRLLKPNPKILCSDMKENAESYSEGNEDFAELTPILDDNSPISDCNPLVTHDTVPSADLTSSTSFQTNKQINQRIELQGISEHSKLLEGCETFISSKDLENKPFIKFPEFILLNGKKMKPEDYNRYIMTNIPHFGYLGANQNEQSKSIYINWPFGDKVLRFPNVHAAIAFLKRRFTNLLLTIPASFQISFIILRELEPTNNFPVNAKILNGTHICGEFGILDSRKLTSPLAKSLGTTQEDVLKRLAKRAHYLGAMEIGKLKEQEKKLIQVKRDLIFRKQNNLTKFMDLLMHLPEKQRLEEYDKFRHQFNERVKHSSTETNKSYSSRRGQELTECIEIEDSDSENETLNNNSGTKSLSSHLQPTILPENHVMQSNLKPSAQTFVQSSSSTSKTSENSKFIKSASGKLLILKDTSDNTFSTSLSGMKMTIRNNQVIKRHETIDTNNDIHAVERTRIRDENNTNIDEVLIKNTEENSVVTLDESDESDLELLE